MAFDPRLNLLNLDVVNYGLGHISGALAPWKYMYLVAGSLTIVWSFVILFFMPPDPIRMKSLSERERYIAVARMRVNNAGVRNTHFKWAQVTEVLIDVRFWIVFAMAFMIMIANGPGMRTKSLLDMKMKCANVLQCRHSFQSSSKLSISR